jgi:tRNA pseudouridine55 synthase
VNRASDAAGPRPPQAGSPHASRRACPGADGPHGVLVVAKPAGPSSHDIVALVRRLSGAKRVGHGGTLDPFASGVLPVFVGSATRMVEYHLHDAKAYRALVCFGARSTTDDIEGELSPGEAAPPAREAVEALLPAFVGRVVQRPPAYSAVKVGGRRAYEMARRGEQPLLRDREVEIHELRLTGWQDDQTRPCATLEVRCSAGTYVRALARDLGERLGCGAYLAALVRTASGPFRIADAIELDELRRLLAEGSLAGRLLPPDVGLDAYPAVSLSPIELAAVARGQVVRLRGEAPAPGPDGLVRVVVEGQGLVAMARLRDRRLYPDKVLVGAATGDLAGTAASAAD